MKKNISELSQIQFAVTQEDATEPPYTNQYCDFFEEGIYTDIVSGEPLFISIDKFSSPCGWPAFSNELITGNIKEVKDLSCGIERIEVRSPIANSHLGHVFNDGPTSTGIRYCINSAALGFVPKNELVSNGLEKYLELFDKVRNNG
jgi:methionine-R-sulfoxide reductase